MSRILTAAEVGAFLRVSTRCVLAMVANRELPALVVLGGDALISEAALRELVDGAWRQPREDR